MPAHKTKLIINPNANMGSAWRIAADLRSIVEEFGGADWSGTVYPTHAIELAKQAAQEGYELIIAVGGDGTVHEVINGIMLVPKEKRPRLGVVPLGSGNDFAHAIGMKEDPFEALHQIFTGSSKLIDLGYLEDNRGRREYIDNSIGIGFDATVTIRSHKLPVIRGFLMYLVAVLQTIAMDHNLPMLQFESDQESWEGKTTMLVMCNGPREGGGFLVAPDAVNNDGIFHYASIGDVSRAFMLRLVPEVMRGTHGRFDKVRMGSFKTLKITADQPLFIHTDGEVFCGFGTDVHALNLEVIPDALEIVV
ncbi:MAG: diacylglycerol kinase family lipid kinase [Anaerolineae bacterium]|nr:diacylglycerol kinase family lipid kinase [Anaerolineae bacterium]